MNNVVSLQGNIVGIGNKGYSAYEVAVQNGYKGTEEEWLASLEGEDGITPHIGENGNWYLGTTDTGVQAQGPQGPTGPEGSTGPTGPSGPAGADGTDGEDGTDGITPHIGSNGNWYLGDSDTEVSAQGPTGPQGPQGATGQDGEDGVSATIQVGTVTTLDAGQNATVTNVGTSTNAIFNFGIPKGADGTGGGGGITSETDPTVPSHVKSITSEDISNWNAKMGQQVFYINDSSYSFDLETMDLGFYYIKDLNKLKYKTDNNNVTFDYHSFLFTRNDFDNMIEDTVIGVLFDCARLNSKEITFYYAPVKYRPSYDDVTVDNNVLSNSDIDLSSFALLSDIPTNLADISNTTTTNISTLGIGAYLYTGNTTNLLFDNEDMGVLLYKNSLIVVAEYETQTGNYSNVYGIYTPDNYIRIIDSEIGPTMDILDSSIMPVKLNPVTIGSTKYVNANNVGLFAYGDKSNFYVTEQCYLAFLTNETTAPTQNGYMLYPNQTFTIFANNWGVDGIESLIIIVEAGATVLNSDNSTVIESFITSENIYRMSVVDELPVTEEDNVLYLVKESTTSTTSSTTNTTQASEVVNTPASTETTVDNAEVTDTTETEVS